MAKQQQPTDDDFKNLIDLLAVYSDASHRIAGMESDVNSDLLELIDEKKSEYATLQRAMTEAETACELICRKHDDWFTEKKSIKTPYGTVSFKKSSKLKSKNEELTIHIIEHDLQNPQKYLREEKHLNLEALELLDDETLSRLKIERVSEDNFSVKEAKVDLGKAVKEAAEEKKAA